MSVEADPGWRIVAAASVAAIYRTLPRGATTIRAKAIGSCFLRGRRQEGTSEQCGVENDWAACWSITKGKRHKSPTGQRAMGLTFSTYIKDAGNRSEEHTSELQS